MEAKKEDRSVLGEIIKELHSLDPKQHPVAFAFTLVSALDLLSQLNSGKLKKIGAVKRFKRFTAEYMGLREFDQELIYQFRNATVHTFGQYAFNEKTKKEYRFVFHSDDNNWCTKVSRVVYSINLIVLKAKLEKAVDRFYDNLANDPSLKERHDLVYKKIGTTIQRESN